MSYKVTSAVLFIVFNRPDTTQIVFEQIKKAQPSRLYIAADGARTSVPGEKQLCESTRAVIDKVDWNCEVKTLFRNENLGCKNGVSTAIDWFFAQEEEGIILEDDCLPADDFFKFCDVLLEKYRLDTRIRIISGCNLHHGKKWGNASYYYSNMTHIWGWASWKRVWIDYDKTLFRFDENDVRPQLKKIFNSDFIADKWLNIFIDVKAGKIDTWDHQLSFLNFFNNGLSIIPNHNLISNIGFGVNPTHTFDQNSPNANIPLEELGDIIHPLYVLPEKDADTATLNQEFDFAKYNLRRRRFKRWLRKKISF